MKELRIGIVGTGTGNSIARRFATACTMVYGVRIEAVCSRDPEKGRAFAKEFYIPHVFSSVEELARADLDLVYVATPHPFHFHCAKTALLAGKSVLCEKPMCLTEAEASELFALAQDRSLFLMEGMWTRFLPTSCLALSWVQEGRIGQLRFIDGMFSFAIDPKDVKPRLVDPALGGGALYDVGVYTLEMASYYAGCTPVAWTGQAVPYCPGVDALSALTLRFPNDILATLRMGITCHSDSTMTLYGTKGRIELPRFFSAPEVRLYKGSQLEEVFTQDCELPLGFTWEIEAVRECMLSGSLQNPLMPAQVTIQTARIMQELMHSFFPL